MQFTNKNWPANCYDVTRRNLLLSATVRTKILHSEKLTVFSNLSKYWFHDYNHNFISLFFQKICFSICFSTCQWMERSPLVGVFNVMKQEKKKSYFYEEMCWNYLQSLKSGNYHDTKFNWKKTFTVYCCFLHFHSKQRDDLWRIKLCLVSFALYW